MIFVVEIMVPDADADGQRRHLQHFPSFRKEIKPGEYIPKFAVNAVIAVVSPRAALTACHAFI